VMGTGVAHTLPAYIEWLKIINDEEISMDIVQAPMRIELGKDLWMDILWPIDNFAGINVDDNNETSIIAKLVYGDISFLLTGDATVEVEKEMLNADIDLISDVLKIGHHGSKGSTSLEFVEAVKPEFAVISVGVDNRFGHPTRRVLKNLEDVGVIVLRTDESGDIKISSDGKSIYLLNESQ